MNIGNRILIVFTLLSAIVLAGSGVVWFQLRAVDHAFRNVFDYAEPINAATQEMEINAVETAFSVMEYLHQPLAEHRELFATDGEEFQVALARFSTLARTPAEQQLVIETAAIFAEIVGRGQELMTMRDRKTALFTEFQATILRIEEANEGNESVFVGADKTGHAAEAAGAFSKEASETAQWLLTLLGAESSEAPAEIADHLAGLDLAIQELAAIELSGEEARLRDLSVAEHQSMAALVREALELHLRFTRTVDVFVTARQRMDDVLDGQIQRASNEVLATAKTETVSKQDGIRLIVALLGMLFVATSSVAYLMLNKRVIRPLLGFSRRLGPISEAGIDQRLGYRHHDELGLFAARFNRMARRAARLYRSLADSNVALEARVAERTAEISEASHRLSAELRNSEELQGELQTAKAGAEQASSSKSLFLANASHELRTPLNAIIGFSDMILQNMIAPDDAEKRQEYIGIINSSGKHLLSVVNDILDVARIEAHKIELQETEFNIHDAVKDCMSMIKARPEVATLRLVVEVPENLPEIYADRRLTMQILINLVGNAIKFTKSGGEVKLQAEIGAKGGMVLIVSDTGIGIAKEDIKAVLEPFKQSGNAITRPHGGLGLGLAITRSFAELHGGELKLESTLGVGTRVSVHFPPNRTQGVPGPSRRGAGAAQRP